MCLIFFLGFLLLLLIFSRPSQFNILLRTHRPCTDVGIRISYNQLNEFTRHSYTQHIQIQMHGVTQWYTHTHWQRSEPQPSWAQLSSAQAQLNRIHSLYYIAINCFACFYVSASCFASLMLLSSLFVTLCALFLFFFGLACAFFFFSLFNSRCIHFVFAWLPAFRSQHSLYFSFCSFGRSLFLALLYWIYSVWTVDAECLFGTA